MGTKSDIVRCLEDATEEQDDTSVDVVVLDGLAILYVLKPAAAGTFCESYVHDVVLFLFFFFGAGQHFPAT